MVKKLILVSSGPFEDKYAALIMSRVSTISMTAKRKRFYRCHPRSIQAA